MWVQPKNELTNKTFENTFMKTLILVQNSRGTFLANDTSVLDIPKFLDKRRIFPCQVHERGTEILHCKRQNTNDVKVNDNHINLKISAMTSFYVILKRIFIIFF